MRSELKKVSDMKVEVELIKKPVRVVCRVQDGERAEG